MRSNLHDLRLICNPWRIITARNFHLHSIKRKSPLLSMRVYCRFSYNSAYIISNTAACSFRTAGLPPATRAARHSPHNTSGRVSTAFFFPPPGPLCFYIFGVESRGGGLMDFKHCMQYRNSKYFEDSLARLMRLTAIL